MKPGNIIVVRGDEGAVPKIIDFGLARATNRELLAQTVLTEREQLLGTPEYMAPEQAGGSAELIDTRADIYSLGVVLYELLCGVLPISRAELREAGWVGIQRLLTEREPPRPSTRLTSTADEAERHARRMQISLVSLSRRSSAATSTG